MSVISRRWFVVAVAVLAALVAPDAVGAPTGTARELEEYFQTREARITYSFAHRAILEGQVAGARGEDPYQLLAGNVEQLNVNRNDDPALGRAALLETTEAVVAHPQVVTIGLGRGLAGAGVMRYLDSYRVYRAWAAGDSISAEERRQFRRGKSALEDIELGRRLIAEARGHTAVPQGWEKRIAPLRTRLEELREELSDADGLETFEALRPLIDEACAALDDYPPYRRHRDKLRTMIADGSRVLGNTLARAHARVMAPGANMQRTNLYRGRAVRKLNEIAWKHDAGDPVRGQPAVSYNTIYYAASGRYRWDPLRVFALDLPTLEERWSFQAPARRGYSVTIHGGRLYVSCGDVGSTPSYICCLDGATGKPQWVFEGPRGEDNTLSHPAADDGSVYVADRWGSLFALDANTGAERWRREVEPGRRATAPTPTLAEGVVYLPSTHYIVAIEADNGEELWRLDASVGEGVVAVDDDVMYVCDRGLAAYSLDERRYLWSFEPPGAAPFRGGPAITGKTVFARDGRTLYAVDRSNGRQEWKFASPKPFDWKVSPVVAEGVVYIGTEGVQAGSDGEGAYLYAIDATTGRRLWEIQVETSLYGSPPVIADGTVYFSSGRYLYAAH